MEKERLLLDAANLMITEVAERSGVDRRYALDQIQQMVNELIRNGGKMVTGKALIDLTVIRILKKTNKPQ